MNKERRFVKGLAGILLGFVLIMSFSMLNNQTAEAASSSRYLIKVNRKQACVTVYEQDEDGKYTKPVKAFPCSPGYKTPIGTFHTQVRYKWKILLEDVWGQYCTRIVDDILFHSVYYYKQDASALAWRQYNRLGTICSHGCVRLSVYDAKWIYDNCGIGTTVVIYDSNNPGPLGKPKGMKLPSATGWDPTDVTNPKNPWNKKKPKITGAKDLTVEYGDKLDLLKGVKAYNTAGTDATELLEVKGKVNTTKTGKYKVTYSVKDQAGKTAKKTIRVTVKTKPGRVVFTGIKDQVFNASVKRSQLSKLALNGVSVSCSNKKVYKRDIKVAVKKASSGNGYKKYKIVYTIKVGNTTATEKAYFTIDRKAPVISGVKDRIIAESEMAQLRATNTFVDSVALENVSVGDNLSSVQKASIQVGLVNNNNGTYTITYTALDEAGNKTEQNCTLYVLNGDSLVIQNPAAQIVTDLAQVTNDVALSNVKVICNGVDLTDTLKASIAPVMIPVTNGYKVQYNLTIGSTTIISNSASLYQLAQ